MNLKEINGHKKVADVKGSDEVTLEYANQEGSYQVTFKKVKEGYQATERNYYHLIDTPFDASPDYFTPEVGDVITEEQFKELNEFVEEINEGSAQEWWNDLDAEDKEEYVADHFGDESDINELTAEQIEELYFEFGVF